MYTQAASATGATSATLAATGFHNVALVLAAVSLVMGGLGVIRLARRAAGDHRRPAPKFAVQPADRS